MLSKSDNLDSETRYFHVWECAVIQKEHKPNGRKLNEGCGIWQIKASKHKDTMKPKHGTMASCKHGCVGNGGKGPRKARLNPSTRKFYTFDNAGAAIAFRDAMNEQKGGEEE
jgi:hypothetical protein